MAASDGLYHEHAGDSNGTLPEAACGCLPRGADHGAGYARMDARSLASADGAHSPCVGTAQHGSVASGLHQCDAGLRDGERSASCNGISSARQTGSEGNEARNGSEGNESWRKRIARMVHGSSEQNGVAADSKGGTDVSAGDDQRTWGPEERSWDVEAGRGAGSGDGASAETRPRRSAFPYDWFVAKRPHNRQPLQPDERTWRGINARPATPASSASSASASSPAWPSARPSAAPASPPCQQPDEMITSASYEVVADDMEEEEEEEERMSDAGCTDDGLEATTDCHDQLCCCWPLLPASPARPAPLPPADSRASDSSAGNTEGEDAKRSMRGAGEAGKGEAGRGAVAWARSVDWGSRRCQLSIFAAVMLAGLAAAAVVFWATFRSYQHSSMDVLTTLCDTWAALLNERLQDSAKQARVLSALLSILYFRSTPPVLNQLSVHLFHNVAFALRVSPALRPAWEALNNASAPCIMDEGRECAEERMEYAPIVFEELAHAPHRGLDLYQLDQLNATVWRARQQLRAVVSPILAATHAPTAVHFSPAASSDAHLFKVLPVFRSSRAYSPATPGGHDGDEGVASAEVGAGVGEGDLGGFMVAEMDVDGLWKDISKVRRGGTGNWKLAGLLLTRPSVLCATPCLHCMRTLCLPFPAASPAADMVLQIVDVTDGGAPQLVLDASRQAYNPADQVAEGPFARVNSIDFGDQFRQYELRCRYASVPVPVLPVVWMVLVLVVVAGAAYLLCVAQRHLSVARRNLRRMGLLKDRMKRAKVLAEMGNRAKGTFLATMSHELRTPLNGVIGMMNLLLETPLSAVQLDYVDTARTSGRALVDLINDILDLSKIEAKRMVLESAAMDVRSDVVDDVLSMFVDRIRANPHVEVAAYVDPAVPSLIFGDSLRLRQVLMNLLSNSCKYTARGHIFICVRAVRSDEDLRHVLLLHSRTTSHALPHRGGTGPGPHDSSAWRVVSPSALMRPALSGPGAGPGRLQRAYLGSGTLGGDRVLREGGEGEEGVEGGGWSSSRDDDSASMCGEEGRGSMEREKERERERRCYETLSGYEAVESCNSWAHVRMQQQPMACGGALEQGASRGGAGGRGVAASSGMVRLVVSVEDTGEGIPLSAQKSIFKRFVQADASSTRTHGGTGIGLTISRHLVHLMGGKLSFVSRPGIGTTFYFDFTVPFHAPKPPAAAAAAPGSAGAAVGGRAGRGASSINSSDCVFTAPPLSPPTLQHQDALYQGAAAASLGISCSPSPSLCPPPLHLMPPPTPPSVRSPLPVHEAPPSTQSAAEAAALSPKAAAAAVAVAGQHVCWCPAALSGPYAGVAAVVLDDWAVRRAVMHTYLARLGVTVLHADAHAHGHACMCHGEQQAAGHGVEGGPHGSARTAAGLQGDASAENGRDMAVAALGSTSAGTEGVSAGGAGGSAGSWEAVWAARGMVVVVEHEWLADRGGLARGWRHRVEAAAGWVVQQYRRSHHHALTAATPHTGGAANSSMAGAAEQGRWFGLPERWRAIVVLRDARQAGGLKQRHGVAAVLIKPIRHAALAGCLGEALGVDGAPAAHALPAQPAPALHMPASVLLTHSPAARVGLDGGGRGGVCDESEDGEEAPLLPLSASVGSSPAVRGCCVPLAARSGMQHRSRSTSALAALCGAGRGAHGGEGLGAEQAHVREGGGGGEEASARSVCEGRGGMAESVVGERVPAVAAENGGPRWAAGATRGGIEVGGGGVMSSVRHKSAAAARLCHALEGSKFLVVSASCSELHARMLDSIVLLPARPPCCPSASFPCPHVDDNMVNRKVISKMLQRYGVHVEAVEGGAQALQRLQQPHEFVGVFMDVQMPGMNGFQATRAIRNMEAAQPAACTAPLPTAATAQESVPATPVALADPHTQAPPYPGVPSPLPAAATAQRGTVAPPPPSSPCPPPASPCTPPCRPAPRQRLLVFALTADIGGGTRERCAVVGMDGYMTKPIEEDQLASVVLPFFHPPPTAPHTHPPLSADPTAPPP
ncbi:unnamed protein product [Closterium sp. Naga37s-1]|nr:unnamed protein product [Closterium sp. Naga37s-1]